MKRKILLSVLALFVFSVFTISVNAAPSTVLQIPYLTESKAPTKVPKANQKRLVTLTEEFDFSGVEFETADGGSLNGSSSMQKIIVFDGTPTQLVMTSENKPGILDPASFGDPEKLFKDWYTAYCLDASKQYPLYGMYNTAAYLAAYQNFTTKLAAYQADTENATKAAEMETAAAQIVNLLVRGAVVNSDAMKEYVSGGQQIVVEGKYSLPAGKMNYQVVQGIASDPLGDITVTINSIEVDGTEKTVGKELTFTALDATFDRYIVTDDVASKYASALWILEHSYPTLSLQKSLDLADVNFDDLKTEISTISGVSDENALAKTVEGYVYATIQYAVCKTVGAEVDGKLLGSTIKNAPELDKLYRYLTKDDHSNYGKNTDVSTKVSISGDTEKYKKTNDGFKFGPFKATYKAIDGGDIILSLADGIEDVKITNGNGTEIDRVPNGGEFYIESSKTAKIGSIKVNAKAEITTFDPLSNRAKIYNPVFGAYQNAITGGVYADKVITGSVDILVNSKTGVENAAVLLMVTLVAFSLGYLVLSYKGKPVELS